MGATTHVGNIIMLHRKLDKMEFDSHFHMCWQIALLTQFFVITKLVFISLVVLTLESKVNKQVIIPHPWRLRLWGVSPIVFYWFGYTVQFLHLVTYFLTRVVFSFSHFYCVVEHAHSISNPKLTVKKALWIQSNRT